MTPNGRTPLCEAVRTDNVKMAQQLLSSGANIDAVSPGMKNATPLTAAVIAKHEKMVVFLIGVSMLFTGTSRFPSFYHVILDSYEQIKLARSHCISFL